MMRGATLCVLAVVLAMGGGRSEPPPVGGALVAVASNFAGTFEALEEAFESGSEYRITMTMGSTGQLYAQVREGAPFDVLLAADQLRPRLLASEGLGLPATRRTYALGQLALWSPNAQWPGQDPGQALEAGALRRLAIANPDLAPYGLAARQFLRSVGLEGKLDRRLVMGQNVSHAYTLVASGNAELGIVALSLLQDDAGGSRGRHWVLPSDSHAPIRQDLVLLQRGAGNDAALAFLDFLEGEVARDIISRAGYLIPEP